MEAIDGAIRAIPFVLMEPGLGPTLIGLKISYPRYLCDLYGMDGVRTDPEKKFSLRKQGRGNVCVAASTQVGAPLVFVCTFRGPASSEIGSR